MPRAVTVDEQRVLELASLGCTDKEIAIRLGVSERTVQRKARQALDAGRAKLRESLRAAQIKAALQGNVSMLIWLGKQYLNQRERQSVAHEGETLEIVETLVTSRADAPAS